MATIPGPIILIIGLGVGIFSFIQNDKGFELNGAFSLFLYFGIIMSLYGLTKTLIWLMTRKSGEEIKEETTQQIQNNQPQQQMSAFDRLQRTDFDREREALTARCPSCGFLNYAQANFCQSCGRQLR